MDVRSLLKQIFHILTAPANGAVEDPIDPWEDRVIRLAIKHWIFKAGQPIPAWDQLRHSIEIADG